MSILDEKYGSFHISGRVDKTIEQAAKTIMQINRLIMSNKYLLSLVSDKDAINNAVQSEMSGISFDELLKKESCAVNTFLAKRFLEYGKSVAKLLNQPQPEMPAEYTPEDARLFTDFCMKKIGLKQGTNERYNDEIILKFMRIFNNGYVEDFQKTLDSLRKFWKDAQFREYNILINSNIDTIQQYSNIAKKAYSDISAKKLPE